MPLLETFSEMISSPAHWQFELLVGVLEIAVVNGIFGIVLWPLVKRHIHRDIQHGPEPEGEDDVLVNRIRKYTGEA